MAAGKPHGLKPGHTSSIRRIEGGMLSYHADADINTNPYEVGLGRLVNLDTNINFVGKDALKKINKDGIKRKQVGVILDSDPLTGPNTTFWEITKDNEVVGKITSAVYSPRLKQNIAMFCFSLGEYTAEVILPTTSLSLVISQKVVLGPVKGSLSKITPTCFLLMPSLFIFFKASLPTKFMLVSRLTSLPNPTS